MAKRIRMSRQHPWRADNPDAVIVARPTKWGNPYTIAMMQERIDRLTAELDADPTAFDARAMAVEAFRCDLSYGPDSVWWWYGPHMGIIRIKGALQDGELAGRDLACWCPLDQPCHADVLLDLANAAVLSCSKCGCTDDRACFPTCSWVHRENEPPLCSKCAPRTFATWGL